MLKFIIVAGLAMVTFGCASMTNTKLAETCGAISSVLPPVTVTVGFEFGRKTQAEKESGVANGSGEAGKVQ